LEWLQHRDIFDARLHGIRSKQHFKEGLFMSDQWHYMRNGEQFGPISVHELSIMANNGQLVQSQMIWTEGMPAWLPAQNFWPLLISAAGAPPTFNAITHHPVSITEPAPFEPMYNPYSSTRQTRGSKSFVAGHSYNAPTINVNLPKRSSSLGIVSLILGIVAFIFSFIPFVGIVSALIGGIGLLLAFIGLIVALGRSGSGIGWPIGGGVLSGVALAIALLQGAVFSSIAHTQERNQATNQQVVGGGAMPISHSDARATTDTKEWAPAQNAVRQGDVQIRITSIEVATVKLKGNLGGETSRSEDAQLIIDLEVRNLSSSKKLDYCSWAGRDFGILRDFASVEDNFANSYKRIDFGLTMRPVNRAASDSVYPGKLITDELVFEVPVVNAEFLNLELPAENFGGQGMIRFRIPAPMIRR
jgi:hypothetical protein